MGQAITHLTDVMVSRGFESKPQAAFTPRDGNPQYGTIRLKASNMRKRKDVTEYDNYTIEWQDAPAGVVELLNQKNVRIAIYGEQSHEVFNDVPFTKILARGPGALVITKYGEKSEVKPETRQREPREEL